MVLIEAVFSYCRFVRLGQSDMFPIYFYPKLDEPSALSDVHIAAFTGECYSPSFLFGIMRVKADSRSRKSPL